MYPLDKTRPRNPHSHPLTLALTRRQPRPARPNANPAQPWWSLPETIRAADGVRLLARLSAAPDRARVEAECGRISAACEAALERFVSRVEVAGAGTLALLVQMRGADGAVRHAIPATSDLDPGFHTGLALIDALRYRAACAE